MSIRAIATGIGSLPFKDPAQAVDLVLRYLPEAPFWPQLPKRNVREGMVAQYSEGMPGLKVTGDGLQFDRKEAEDSLEAFYGHIISMDLDHFRIGESYAAGLYEFYNRLKRQGVAGLKFIKCHVTGPFTFAASITAAGGAALIHDDVLMQAMAKGLAMKALWQIRLFREFGKPVVVFIDEPYLAGFGSAFTALTRETAVRVLEEMATALKTPDVLVGVHCCGNTDWSIFTDIKTIDIINFDAFSYVDKFTLYGSDMAQFLERGGYICWGIVPTQEFKPGLTVASLAGMIHSGISALANKGADRALLAEQLLISPSCGLGALEPAAADLIFRLLNGLSTHMRATPPGA
ncbi:MAG TPA: methionine synthase [Candidatus Omnitrophota bacterium]|nr:methionine synthase [Candidatus Omnitrophota bacterium]HNQ51338.1 methionine synthase [Candidatus Omnitrophota bacterium]HQO38662.1 methionine synthase [Candidatus Omnitrophota bacterium]HQQ06026.1 methionine synthase [Candidatus Omnitrophota bacterium]